MFDRLSIWQRQPLVSIPDAWLNQNNPGRVSVLPVQHQPGTLRHLAIDQINGLLLFHFEAGMATIRKDTRRATGIRFTSCMNDGIGNRIPHLIHRIGDSPCKSTYMYVIGHASHRQVAGGNGTASEHEKKVPCSLPAHLRLTSALLDTYM